MMKKYYILSKNTTVESYQSIFNSFELKDIEIVSYDRAVNHVFVSDIISAKDSLVLLIPTILDPFNAYSYDGVEYALKYYFHFVSIKKCDFQIILLGTEEESAFWRHCEYSSFLRCPHVSYLKNNIYPIKDCLARIGSVAMDMDWAYCIERLKQLDIKKPASYKTHHSITNEWSIYRWSKYLGIENIEIKKEIEDFLYFNYLKAIYPEKHIDSKKILLLEKGKVLLIDDEVGKGWSSFFKSFCNKYTGTEFDSIGETFKNLSAEEIIIAAEEKVKKYCPDVVVLDLRLHDDDFDNKEPLQLTGARVFERIKKINEGIQIVVFSASNKVWNYLPLASDGVILKESPELSVRENYTQECIKNMLETLRTSLERGSFLSKLYGDVESTKQKLPNNDFGNSISNQLNIAYYLISRAEKSEQYAFAYVSLYQIIEIITDELIAKEQIQANPSINKWKLSDGIYIHEYKWDSQIKSYQDMGEAQSGKEPFPQWKKMAGLVLQEWAVPNGDRLVRDLSFSIEKRNGFIHNDKTILDKQDKNTGKYLNHDIYDNSGFKSLFDSIKTICSYL